MDCGCGNQKEKCRGIILDFLDQMKCNKLQLLKSVQSNRKLIVRL
jgi:hypothetical protein